MRCDQPEGPELFDKNCIGLRRLLLVVLFAAVLSPVFAAPAPLPADRVPQQRKHAVTAELAGHIVTSSGEPFAGATASLENLDTHHEEQTKSTVDGIFRFTGLPAGEYRLQVTALGFKTFAVPQLPLVAGDAAKANAILVPGNAAEVVVGSDTSVTSRMGTNLAGKTVSDLPENQRNFVNLVQVSAGANEGSTNSAASASRPGAQHQSSAVSVGGQPETTNNSQIDGIDNNERINSEIVVHPSVEGIDTVQVLANAYPAAMGHAGGGVINVISKSGSNTLHGSVYEYFRNDIVDAFPYQFGAQNRKPELRQNQYGASLGGPLQRQKTYFFGDFEGFRLIQGRAPAEQTVPTAYEHEHPGDFTDAGGPLLTRLDPVGLAYFRLYPEPNVPGSTNQFVSGPSGSNNSTIADLRIDRKFSERDQFFSRFSYNRTLVYIPGQFPPVVEDGMTVQPGGSLSSFAGNMDDTGVNTVLDYSHVFRPTLILDLRAGYTFWSEADTSLNPNVAANQGFGQPNINLSSTANGLAPISMVQAAPLGTDGFYRPINQVDNTFQYGGSLAWSSHRHALDAGATLIRRQWSDLGSGASLGMWTVNDLPSLLQGQFLSVDREVDLDDPHYRTWEPSVYVQDTWKPAPALTLDFGLRYDYFAPVLELEDRMSNFDLMTGRIVLAGRDGVSQSAGVRTDRANFGPRIGLSLEVGRKTTLRAGYGIVYFRPLDDFVYQTQPFVYAFGVCSSQTCPSGYTTLAAGLPAPRTPDPTHPSGILWGLRSFGLHSSQMQQFNLGLERQIAGDTLRIFYVAALGQHIARAFPDLNAPPPNTSADPQALRPYYATVPEVTAMVYHDSEGSSSYNALQATLALASRKGLTAHLNYTLAHGLDNVSAQGFGTVPSISSTLDYGNSSFDVRQRAVATAFYDLPFGKHASGTRGLMTRGWQVNLAGVWSTGLPFTVLNANDVSNTYPGASAADRPDRIANPALRHPTVTRYFNTDAFQAQAPGTLGTERSNQLYGPPSKHLDGSLFKNISLHKEAALQLRLEVFNLMNTANFASPAAVLGGANFGQLTQMTAGYAPREIQFAARVQF
jgi:Carboxypeptidase regulatory-like domain/TonB dependent receptor